MRPVGLVERNYVTGFITIEMPKHTLNGSVHLDVVLVSVTHLSSYFHFQPRTEMYMPGNYGSSRVKSGSAK